MIPMWKANPTKEDFRELLKAAQAFHTTVFKMVEIQTQERRQAELGKIRKEFTIYGNMLRYYGHLIDPRW